MSRELRQRAPLTALIIGAGPAAVEMHLPVLARLRDSGELALRLICDLRHERAASACRAFGFSEATGDGVAAVARPDIDVVYVFGSAQLHFEYGLAALRAGKHLFVEKPLAPSYEAARELARAARQRARIAVGGHNRRFHEPLVRARELAGKSGWRYAEAVFHKPEFGKTPSYGARTWLSANGIHALDALVFMMNGLPEELTALVGEAGEAQPSAFSALLRWRDGAQGVFLCNNNAGARREEYVFHGLGESCRIDEAGLLVEKGGKSSRTPSPPHDRGITAEHEAFLHAVRTGIEPVHSIARIAPSLFLCELIERGFTGRVRLPDTETIRPLAAHSPAGSMLVVRPAELQPALSRWLPDVRLVSLAELQASAKPRPDIVAAVLGRGADPLSPELLAQLPRLGMLGVVGLSVGRHDPEKLLAHGIAIVNATQAYADSVAEFALALAILGRRRAFASHDIMRRGGWGSAPAPGIARFAARAGRGLRPMFRAVGMESFLLRLWRARSGMPPTSSPAMQPRELRGATIGLVGWSANARAFAERLLQAHARVLCFSEHASDPDLAAAGVCRVSLAEALAADVVSLHRGLSPDTLHFLGAAELDKLRPGTVFINIARGALVEPDALLRRLKRGDIFACLDTYETEPPPASDPLRSLPNVFLTSHIAGGSDDMHAAAAHEVVRKIAGWLVSGKADGITAERLSTMT